MVSYVDEKLQYEMNKEATKISAHFLNEKAKYELNEIIQNLLI